MAKISEAQRKHFVNRIQSKMGEVISSLKQQNAAEITRQSDEHLDEYLKTIGVVEDLESLDELEAARDKVAKRLQVNCEKIQNILKEAGHIGQYDEVRFWDSDNAMKYRESFRKFCNITCSKNNQDGISGEISKLEAKRDEAIDFLYGLSEESELMHGVSKILEGTNVKLIG